MNFNQIMVKMVFDRWHANIKNFDVLLNSITDEQLQNEIAPGRNRGIYVLGHLVAVHDEMITLLNLGEKKYPELKKIFIDTPDKATSEIPKAHELRSYWSNQGRELAQKFESLQAEEWFERHTAVSAEDFVKEPHRNKLNIVLTRTTHLSYHTGQMILLKQKEQ